MSAGESAARLTPERWRQVEAVFIEARDQVSGERSAFLDRACGTDAALRREVESLLAADLGATGFLEPSGVLARANAIASHQVGPPPIARKRLPSPASNSMVRTTWVSQGSQPWWM